MSVIAKFVTTSKVAVEDGHEIIAESVTDGSEENREFFLVCYKERPW